MKRLIRKTKNVVRGMPTAVVVSILIHVGLFFGATALVIFKFRPPPPVKFEPPPPVKVPKMPLKKLNVKMKKPTKPKSSAKITAVVPKLDLHEIQFPDLASSGIGAGLSGGGEVVQFGDMPSFEDEDGLLGKEKSVGNDLEGTYYDIKRSRNGSYNGEGVDTWRAALRNFLYSDWNVQAFSRFYRSPKKRYATCVMLPTMNSSAAPTAFDEDPGSGLFWIVHYKGQIVYPEDITFRFWAAGDEVLVVRVDDEVVAADIWPSCWQYYGSFWQGNDPERKKYRLGHNTTLEPGDWITLKAGEPKDIEIVMGDNGGLAALMLVVQVKDVEYEINEQGGPILPAFKTARLSHDLVDRIYMDLAPNEACLTNGPVFSDFE